MVLLLLLTSKRTRKAAQKCPEKQDKKSKTDMKKLFTNYKYLVEFFNPVIVIIVIYESINHYDHYYGIEKFI